MKTPVPQRYLLKRGKQQIKFVFWILRVEKVVKIFMFLRILLRRVTNFIVLIKDKSLEYVKIF